MGRKKLNLGEEERRKYNNEMHRKQAQGRRKKAEREALKEVVRAILLTFENLGWSDVELIVGADDEMIEKVVEELIKADKFKIVLGSRKGIKIKEKGD